MRNILKEVYIHSAGHSYTNMGRLFLRIYTGIMMMQFGIRQWCNFSLLASNFPTYFGMSPELTLILMIFVEIFCSFCIMIGFCTRAMVLPPMVAMIFAEHYLLTHIGKASYLLTWADPGYVPMLFLGIYCFILLVGPGKISVDYFLSLHFIHIENHNEEDELEEV